MIDIENVVPGANSFASIRPITPTSQPVLRPLCPSPRVFDICLLLPRCYHETGYRRRGGTRVLLDGISNCNDSLSSGCSSYCFPVCFAGETKLQWHEWGEGLSKDRERNALPHRRRKHRVPHCRDCYRRLNAGPRGNVSRFRIIRSIYQRIRMLPCISVLFVRDSWSPWGCRRYLLEESRGNPLLFFCRICLVVRGVEAFVIWIGSVVRLG